MLFGLGLLFGIEVLWLVLVRLFCFSEVVLLCY